MMKANTALILSACLFGGCATSNTFEGERRAGNVEEVAMTPVADVGLSKVDIPQYLLDMRNPYAPTPTECASIVAEVTQLHDLLGDDLDVPEEEAERRELSALNAAGETVSSVLIPFRGVVRAISGASSHDRKAREAYQRGLVRRAYLKGLAKTENCGDVSVTG